MADKLLDPNEDGISLEEKYNRTLAHELALMHKTFSDEFLGKEADDPVVAIKARSKVIEMVPDAGVSLKNLILHAESESVRANLSRWVFEVAMKAADNGNEDNELTRLLNDIKAKASA